MRTTIYALAAVAFILGCGATGGRRTISARIEGAAGRTLYFDRFQANRPVHVDSVKLDAKGHGELPVPAGLPLDFYAISLTSTDMLVIVLDSADKLSVTAQVGHLQEPTALEGSPESALLFDYYKQSQQFETGRKALVDRLNADRSDTAAFTQLNRLNVDFYANTKKFAEAHKGSPAALSAIGNLNAGQELPLFLAVRDALRQRIPGSEYFAGFNAQMDRMQQDMAAQKAQQEQMKQLDNLIPIGSPAPDFKQNTPDGHLLALSDLRGKVVLIDFWASWCRPCRMEMPNVKKVYEQYHPKGFEILGVSLDKDKNAWTGAIQQDGLPWKHISDLAYWDNAVARQYGVGSIPFTVLVDRDGKVLAKGLRGEQLGEKLAELFK